MTLLNFSFIGTPCSRCGELHEREGQRLCLVCHAAYQREWKRNRTRAFRKMVRDASNAQKTTGKIPFQPCAVCGSSDVELHHPDHEMADMTFWLCRRCHMLWHSYWKSTVLNVFAEWLSIARECAAVRKTEAQSERDKEAA